MSTKWNFQDDHDYLEFVEILKDPTLFANLCCDMKINSAIQILDNMVRSKYSYSIAPRQSGKTLTNIIYGLWYAYNFDYSHVMFFVPKDSYASEIVRRIEQIISSMPDFMQPINKNKNEIRLPNSSYITVRSNLNSLRGHSINCLLVDEYAYMTDGVQRDLFSNIIPVLHSMRGELHITTTPNMMGTFAHSVWDDKGNAFNKIHLTWRDFWQEDQLSSYKRYLPQSSWDREYECDWTK